MNLRRRDFMLGLTTFAVLPVSPQSWDHPWLAVMGRTGVRPVGGASVMGWALHVPSPEILAVRRKFLAESRKTQEGYR